MRVECSCGHTTLLSRRFLQHFIYVFIPHIAASSCTLDAEWSTSPASRFSGLSRYSQEQASNAIRALTFYLPQHLHPTHSPSSNLPHAVIADRVRFAFYLMYRTLLPPLCTQVGRWSAVSGCHNLFDQAMRLDGYFHVTPKTGGLFFLISSLFRKGN